MSDIADRAAEREQELRDDALARQARASRKRYVAKSAEICAVCAESIPEIRRQVLPGVQTCIACQKELERALRMKGNRQ